MNPAPSGPLLVDSDWKQLEAHWRAGGSVAWRGSDAICERAYASIEAYRSRSGLGEPVYGAEERRPAGVREIASGLRASAMAGAVDK